MKKILLLFIAFGAIHYYVNQYAHITPLALPGNGPSFYSPQLHNNLEDILANTIRNADSSVALITYTLKSTKIIQALNDAAKKGVSVKVVYDAEASSSTESRLNPEVHSTARRLKGLMHLKLLIIDGKHTWLGSANMTRDSLRYHANLITHLDNELFAKAVLEKANQITGFSYEKPIAPQYFKINNQTLELRFLPDDQEAIARIKNLIRSAKSTIQVAMYTFTREDLADTLIRAKNRGVSVQVVLDTTQSKKTNKKIVDLLSDNGVFVALRDMGSVMHNKFMLVDQEILEHGSANWTRAAFWKNDDYIIIIDPLSEEQKTAMQKIWASLLQST